MKFHVYDQRFPLLNPRTREYEPNIPYSGTVDAKDAAEAIQIATAKRLSRWPIVEQK